MESWCVPRSRPGLHFWLYDTLVHVMLVSQTPVQHFSSKKYPFVVSCLAQLSLFFLLLSVFFPHFKQSTISPPSAFTCSAVLCNERWQNVIMAAWKMTLVQGNYLPWHLLLYRVTNAQSRGGMTQWVEIDWLLWLRVYAMRLGLTKRRHLYHVRYRVENVFQFEFASQYYTLYTSNWNITKPFDVETWMFMNYYKY